MVVEQSKGAIQSLVNKLVAQGASLENVEDAVLAKYPSQNLGDVRALYEEARTILAKIEARKKGHSLEHPILAPRQRGGTPVASGDIPKEITVGMAKAAEQKMARLVQEQYNSVLKKDRAVQGNIVFQIEVLPSGRIGEIALLGNTTGDEHLARNIIAALRDTTRPTFFPETKEGGVFDAPFNLKPG